MAYQPIQTISPEELVDFEDQRRLLEMMLDQSAKKRLMFVQTLRHVRKDKPFTYGAPFTVNGKIFLGAG